MPQSLAKLWVHIIFSTRDRYPFLKNPTVQQKVHQYIKSICYKQDCQAMMVGGIGDHVHILTSLSKNISISKLVEEIKKSSSKWIKTLSSVDEALSQFYWQRGYGAFSVSQSALTAIKSYIQNQQIHHQQQSFQDEFRKFLIRHDVSYSEEYVWG